MTHCQAVIVSGWSCSHCLVGLTPEEVYRNEILQHENELVTGMGEGELNSNPASNSTEAYHIALELAVPWVCFPIDWASVWAS